MAKTTNVNSFDEQNTNDAKGKKIKIARGFVKRIEDVPFVSEQELNKAINIIDKTSGSKDEKHKRKSNLLNDVAGRGFL